MGCPARLWWAVDGQMASARAVVVILKIATVLVK
jgi:hypothetical protein